MIQPSFDRVVLIKITHEAKTQSGILLSQNTQDQTHLGQVVHVGEGRYEHGVLIKPPFKINDVVVYKSYAATTIKHEGQEYLIVDSKDILATIQ
jgi:chaperonin GroES